MVKTLSEIDIHALLPQQEPFVMVGNIVEAEPGDAGGEPGRFATETLIRPDNIFVDNGVFRTAGMVENIAQSCAARMGYISKYVDHSDITIGVIGAVRKLKVLRHPKAGETIVTSIEVMEEVMGVTLAMATIAIGEDVIATCQIKLAQTEAEPDAGNGGKADSGAEAVARQPFHGLGNGVLYKIISFQHNGGEATASIRLNPGCFIYKAHFPGNPITPGVCILQMTCEILGEAAGRSLEISAVKDSRFLSILSPSETPEATITLSSITEGEDGSLSAQAAVSHEGTTFATARMTCR